MKRLIVIVATVTALVAGFAFSSVASADYSVLNDACSQQGATGAACTSQSKSGNAADNPLTGTNGVVHNVTLLVARVGAAVAVIIMIYGGFQLVIGGNDPAKVKTARQTIMYAAVGLVIMAAGQTIIIFVIDRV
ncbi:MAG TPA: hypothetical protein VIM53_04415 [Candidatus Saccharimonadales bacterium]